MEKNQIILFLTTIESNIKDNKIIQSIQDLKQLEPKIQNFFSLECYINFLLANLYEKTNEYRYSVKCLLKCFSKNLITYIDQNVINKFDRLISQVDLNLTLDPKDFSPFLIEYYEDVLNSEKKRFNINFYSYINFSTDIYLIINKKEKIEIKKDNKILKKQFSIEIDNNNNDIFFQIQIKKLIINQNLVKKTKLPQNKEILPFEIKKNILIKTNKLNKEIKFYIINILNNNKENIIIENISGLFKKYFNGPINLNYLEETTILLELDPNQFPIVNIYYNY